MAVFENAIFKKSEKQIVGLFNGNPSNFAIAREAAKSALRKTIFEKIASPSGRPRIAKRYFKSAISGHQADLISFRSAGGPGGRRPTAGPASSSVFSSSFLFFLSFSFLSFSLSPSLSFPPFPSFLPSFSSSFFSRPYDVRAQKD